MTVLITGAAGFFGSWIIRELLDIGERVVLLDVKRDYSRIEWVVPEAKNLPFVEGDITAEGVIENAIERYGVDRIIHLAAFQIPACRKDPVTGAMVNVIGTIRVFEAAKKHKDKVRMVVYASSIAALSPPEHYKVKPIPEDVPLRPVTHYGAFKVCNELCANAYWHEDGIPSATFRPYVVYGFGRDVGATADITRAIKAAVADMSFKIKFGGVVDIQYIRDIAHMFVTAAMRELKGARVYNVRGAIMHVVDIIKLIEELFPNIRGKITYDPTPLALAVDLDDSAAERDLGPLRKTPPREGFLETAGFFEKLKKEGRLDVSDLK